MKTKSAFLKMLVLAFIMLANVAFGQAGKTALLLIDIQYFYFEGGSSALVDPLPASVNAAKLLSSFREKGNLVVHVKHDEGQQSDIHENVKPLDSEKVIVKNEVNSFLNTDLLEYLRANNIENIVLCGMQTHMCLEAATRAAADFGFSCTVIGDACATKDLVFGDKVIKAEDVHYSTLATFKPYAKVLNTDAYLKNGL